MKVFVSSLITGMEDERAAAGRAIVDLGHQPIMAEDFGARAASPQVACLQGVREADLVVLILGLRYGANQASGLSATHEEYREARGSKPILAFVQQGQAQEEQAALIHEVGTWQGGLLWSGFTTPEQLGSLVTRNLHRHELAHAAAPLDPQALASRAPELLPARTHGYSSSGVALHLAIAAGPQSELLRPAEIEADALASAIQQQALFGPTPIFDRRLGVDTSLHEHALEISQERGHAPRGQVRLWPSGDIRLVLPVGEESRDMGLPMVIEEDVGSRLAAGLAYAGWLLETIDPTHRITHVAPVVALAGSGAMGWRTQAEHAASPRSGSTGMFNEQQREQAVMLSPAHRPRAALTMDAQRLVEDLLVLLRRRWKDQ